MKKEKTKEERLQEGMSLLTQLQKGGVRKNALSFLDLQQKISSWVESGTPWDGTVPFPEYGREAVVSLPRYNNKAAGIHFKVVKDSSEENN
jgi:hypothetical protein